LQVRGVSLQRPDFVIVDATVKAMTGCYFFLALALALVPLS
jgi:hypothetical protein